MISLAYSRISMDREKIRKIGKEVLENKRRLKECRRPHNFELEKGSDKIPGMMRKRAFCTKCGGYIGYSEFVWYQIGVEDGEKIESIGESTPAL